MDLLSECASVVDTVVSDAQKAQENYTSYLKMMDEGRDGRGGAYYPLVNILSLAWVEHTEYSKAREIIDSNGNAYEAYRELSHIASQTLAELDAVKIPNHADPMDRMRLTKQKQVWKNIASTCN